VVNRMGRSRQSAVDLPPSRSSKEKLMKVNSSTSIKPSLVPGMGGFYLEKFQSVGVNGFRDRSR
jgi:hypothetical protein